VVVATGSRWCSPPGPGAAAVVAIGADHMRAAGPGAAVSAREVVLGTALDELGEPSAADHEVVLGALAIDRLAVVVATGSRWCAAWAPRRWWRSARTTR